MLWCGLAFLALGLFLLALPRRARYYSPLSGPRTFDVALSLIEKSIKSYWERRYPGDVTCRVKVKKQRLRIFLTLPHASLEKQSFLLQHAEENLAHLLAKTIGYEQPFRLKISFRKEALKSA